MASSSSSSRSSCRPAISIRCKTDVDNNLTATGVGGCGGRDDDGEQCGTAGGWPVGAEQLYVDCTY